MRRTDDQIRGLAERLSTLAEVIPGMKAPTARAVLVWVDTCEDCDPVDVFAALQDWPKANTRAPAPADIRKAALERAGARREREAAERRKTDAGFDLESPPANPVETLSPESRAAYEELRTMLASGVRLFKRIPDADQAPATADRPQL